MTVCLYGMKFELHMHDNMICESILRIVNNHNMIEYKAEKKEDESTFVQSLNFLVNVNLQFCAK